MPLIGYPSLEDLDEQTRGTLRGLQAHDGRIPAFARLLAVKPQVLEVALVQFGGVMFGGDLEPALKQLAFVVVSRANDCAYCVATHGEQLVEALARPASHLDAVGRRDDAELTDRQRAVAEFAHEGAVDPKGVSADHIEALRSVGFDDAEVIELLAVVAQAAFANTIVEAMGVLPSDESEHLAAYDPEHAEVRKGVRR